MYNYKYKRHCHKEDGLPWLTVTKKATFNFGQKSGGCFFG